MTDNPDAGRTGQRYWTYWVAYRHRDGMGACAVSLGLPLRAACQALMLAERIGRDEDVRDVIVLSWQELLTPVVDVTSPAQNESSPVNDADGGMAAVVRFALAAARRVGNPVSSLTLQVNRDEPEVGIHLAEWPSAEQAGELLVQLGLTGDVTIRHFSSEQSFDLHSGVVNFDGVPVLVKVFARVAT